MRGKGGAGEEDKGEEEIERERGVGGGGVESKREAGPRQNECLLISHFPERR